MTMTMTVILGSVFPFNILIENWGVLTESIDEAVHM